MKGVLGRATILVTGAAILGCAPDSNSIATAPMDLKAPSYSLAGGLSVFNGQFSAITSDVTASGHVQVKFPTDPLRNTVPTPPPISVAISGIIFNRDGNNLGSGAGIYVLTPGLGDTFATLVAPIDVGLPPNPIRQHDFSITTELSVELARDMASSTSSYAIRIGNVQAVLVRGGPPI